MFLPSVTKLFSMGQQFSQCGPSCSTNAQMGEGVEQKCTPYVQRGRGFTHVSTYAKMFLFCTCFVIFSYVRNFYHTLSSLVSTFITVLQNICCDCFPVSQMFYSLFLYGILYWIFKRIPIRNKGGARKV